MFGDVNASLVHGNCFKISSAGVLLVLRKVVMVSLIFILESGDSFFKSCFTFFTLFSAKLAHWMLDGKVETCNGLYSSLVKHLQTWYIDVNWAEIKMLGNPCVAKMSLKTSIVFCEVVDKTTLTSGDLLKASTSTKNTVLFHSLKSICTLSHCELGYYHGWLGASAGIAAVVLQAPHSAQRAPMSSSRCGHQM